MTRHPRTFITTAPSSAQATRRRSSSRDPSSTPAICTSPASSARYISSARRATSNLAPSHVPCPPPAARADRAQPPEPHTSPAAHQAGAAQAPDSAPPPQAPAATGSGGLKVTACTAHERSLYSPVFAAASPASTQLPRTLIPQVASGCSGTNIYTAEPA